MKKLFILLLVLQGGFLAFGQTDAILTYENDYSSKISSGKVITTIYESQNKARVESTNSETTSSFGAPKTESQNILLYDFTSQKQTHLNAKTNFAAVANFDVIALESRMLAMGTDYAIQNLGTEQVGNYNCTHYVIT